MLFRLITAWVCNLIDTIATVHLYTVYDGEELNPISAWLLSQSTTTFTVVKMVVMTLAVAFAWWRKDMKICKVASWILFVEYLLVAFYYAIVCAILT